MRNQVPKMYESSTHFKTTASRYGSFHPAASSSSSARNYGSPTRTSHVPSTGATRPARFLPSVPPSAEKPQISVRASSMSRASSLRSELARDKKKTGDSFLTAMDRARTDRDRMKAEKDRTKSVRSASPRPKQKDVDGGRVGGFNGNNNSNKSPRRIAMLEDLAGMKGKSTSSSTRPLPVGPFDGHASKMDGVTTARVRRSTTGSSEGHGSPSSKVTSILRGDHSISKPTTTTTTTTTSALGSSVLVGGSSVNGLSHGAGRSAGQFSPSRGVETGASSSSSMAPTSSSFSSSSSSSLTRTRSVTDLSANFDRLQLSDSSNNGGGVGGGVVGGLSTTRRVVGGSAAAASSLNASNSNSSSKEGGPASSTSKRETGRGSPLRERSAGRLAAVPASSSTSLSAAPSPSSSAIPTKNGNHHHLENCGLKGLRNLGNTCFMNSVIQCLSNTRPLLEFALNDNYINEINKTTSSMKGQLMTAFARLLQDLWKPSSSSSEGFVSPSSFKSAVAKFAPRFTGYAQQDAQEFLRYLLQGLAEDVNRITSKPKPVVVDDEAEDRLSDGEKAANSWKRYLRYEDSRIGEIFVGQLKSTLKCTTCGYASVTFDPFWDLSLPLPKAFGGSGASIRSSSDNANSLHACVALFAREEVLDGDERPKCARCKARRRCTKSFSVQRFPRILVLHLKRFAGVAFRAKLSTLIDFPHSLDLSDFAADAKALNARPLYSLYAVSNHSGSTHSGHYTAYCKHPYSNAWYYYNDSRVSKHSKGGVCSAEGYVLFYEHVG